MKHIVPHSARMRAEHGPGLLTEGIRHYVLLSHQLYAYECAMAQARGHVRMRLAHVVAEMRSELRDLEFVLTAAEQVTGPDAKERKERDVRSIATTREEIIP